MSAYSFAHGAQVRSSTSLRERAQGRESGAAREVTFILLCSCIEHGAIWQGGVLLEDGTSYIPHQEVEPCAFVLVVLVLPHTNPEWTRDPRPAGICHRV